MQNINVKNIDVNRQKFFTYWLQFLKPYHKLRDKEIELLSLLLEKRYTLSQKVNDPMLVDTLLLSTENRKIIMEEMGYHSMQVLTNALSGLRKKKVLEDNSIIKGLIPEINDSTGNFKLIFNFNIKNG